MESATEKNIEKKFVKEIIIAKKRRKLLKALNPEASKERLKNQRIAKAIYRQKKIKEAKEKATVHSEP